MTELVMADHPDLPVSTSSSTLPRSAKRCRIPRLNRSTSVRLRNDRVDGLKAEARPKSMTLSCTKDYPWQLEGRYGDLGSVTSMPFSVNDDDSSVKSFGSFVSYNSSHASQGTAESSRPISRYSHYGKRYVLHCDRHLAQRGGEAEYLTPTQRKDREIRHLKAALLKQTKGCEEKEAELTRVREELARLQNALAELQIRKDSLMNSSQESDSLDAKNNSSVISFESDHSGSDIRTTVTVHHNDDSGISNVMSNSLSPRNSSEFDDTDAQMASITMLQQSKPVATADKAVCTDFPLVDSLSQTTFTEAPEPLPHRLCPRAPAPILEIRQVEEEVVSSSPQRLSLEFERFLATYKRELDDLKSQHKEHYHDLKERFNDRVDDLLRKLAEANTRYLELRPLFDRAQDKIETIESQLTEVQKDIETQEDYHNQMYLKMYRKGQESARFERDDHTSSSPKRASAPDLLLQLQELEAELQQTRQLYREAARGVGDRQAEYTLRFLKDAVFYFLTKKDKEHLKAIQSILGFTDAERMAVAKAMKHRRL